MSVYRGEEHAICVVGLCVSAFLPTTRRGTCRSACGQWNHVNESWKTWHQVSKQRFPAFPRPRRPVPVPFHEERVSLFCKRSLLWQLNHLHLSISQCSQVRTMCMPPHAVLTSAIDLFCFKLACVTIFPPTLSQNKTEMMSTWNNTQRVLVWPKPVFTCGSV